MKTLLKKLENTRQLIAEYKTNEKYLNSFRGEYDRRAWCNAYDDSKEAEQKAVRAIKNLAKECGFKIDAKKQKYVFQVEPAFRAMDIRIKEAYKALHSDIFFSSYISELD